MQDKKEAIRVEITWLLAASFIKEVYHPEWLANLVLVRKKNKEWRICIDYTDLNKHCPKDPFGLPRIDEVIFYVIFEAGLYSAAFLSLNDMVM